VLEKLGYGETVEGFPQLCVILRYLYCGGGNVRRVASSVNIYIPQNFTDLKV